MSTLQRARNAAIIFIISACNASSRDQLSDFYDVFQQRLLSFDTVEAFLPMPPDNAQGLASAWFADEKHQKAFTFLTTFPTPLTDFVSQREERMKVLQENGLFSREGTIIVPLSDEWYARFSGLGLRIYNLWQEIDGDRSKEIEIVTKELEGSIEGAKTYQTVSGAVEAQMLTGLLKKYGISALQVLPTFVFKIDPTAGLEDGNVLLLTSRPDTLRFFSDDKEWADFCASMTDDVIEALFLLSRHGNQWKHPRSLLARDDSGRLFVATAEQPDNRAPREALGNSSDHKRNTATYAGLVELADALKSSNNVAGLAYLKSRICEDDELLQQPYFGLLYKEAFCSAQ